MTTVGVTKSQLAGYEYYLGLNYKFRLFMSALKLSLIQSFDIKPGNSVGLHSER